MKMKFRDHKKIGVVIQEHIDVLRSICCDYADLAYEARTDDLRDKYVISFKAHMLMLCALEDLCNEYDFDCVTAGDEDACDF